MLREQYRVPVVFKGMVEENKVDIRRGEVQPLENSPHEQDVYFIGKQGVFPSLFLYS